MYAITQALKKLAVFQPFIILVLLVLTWVFGVLSVVRGHTITNLQSKLIEQQDKEIKVILDTTELAGAITDKYVNEKHTHEVRYEKVKGDVETIIKENTVFLNTCISDDGVQLYNNFVSTTTGTEPASAVSNTGSTR